MTVLPTYDGTPILSEDCEPDGLPLFEMWAGAYGDVKAFVFARSFERALEHFAEYLDDRAPGCLTSFSEDDYREAAEELGLTWPVPDEQLGRVVERAEVDHTSLGHTTLKNGTHIASWEWGGHDVTSEAIIASCRRLLGNRFAAIAQDNPEHARILAAAFVAVHECHLDGEPLQLEAALRCARRLTGEDCLGYLSGSHFPEGEISPLDVIAIRDEEAWPFLEES